MKRNLILVLLFIHSAISIFVFEKVSFWSAFPPFPDLHTYQIFSDLSVSLTLVLFFILIEMRRKQKPLAPLAGCAVGTILLGSFAPLIFLLWKKDLFE